MSNNLFIIDIDITKNYILEFETLILEMITSSEKNIPTLNMVKSRIEYLKAYWELLDFEVLTDLEKNELYYLNHNILKEIILFKCYENPNLTFTEEEFFEKINAFLDKNPIKINDEENIIHFIWIGVISENVSDYLKIWSETNEKWKINFYYEPEGYLIKTLNELIKEKSSWDRVTPIREQIEKIINFQDDFFTNYDYQKSIDQNIKEFILQNKWMVEKEIDKIIEEASIIHEKTFKNLNNINKIKVTENEFFENKDIFLLNQKQRHKIYLQELLLRQHFPAASDILRYEILFKQGGYYFDCDVLPKINPKIIPFIKKATDHLIPKTAETSLFF
ncbi:TcdA/TcdB catalytic glycosyltransferase domain-containing protein [Spiroplasma endosymbiont of Nebria brevicollis]|uniref:TcdA/TcdB catalytic glycosyltransferase domain-containing protein n=1 Tax=Spiroplasma endosymbiont of Nebria brevicollis TaxID=3066284 RepID=UPI00313F0509